MSAFHTWLPYLLLLAVVAAAAVMDLRTGRVFNALTYPAMLGGLFYWAVVGAARLPDDGVTWQAGAWALFKDSGVATLAALVPMAALVLMGGLGGGDMKLMGAVGAWTASAHAVLITGINALIVAVVMAVLVMVRKGVVKQTLARLVGAAAMASARVKPALPPAPGNGPEEPDGGADPAVPPSPTVPFAAAIAVGAALAGAERFLGWTPPWGSW